MQKETSARMSWTILGSATLLGFAMWAPMFCVPPMQHILKEKLLLTYAETSLLFTAPILTMVALAIPGGIIADRIGIRKAAGIGAIIIAVGTVLRTTATDASTLLAFTFIFGVGLGLSFPNLPKLVSTRVPLEKAGIATGIFSLGLISGSAVAMSITMPLVFPLTNTFHGVFLFWSIPPIVAAALWWILVREDRHGNDHAYSSRVKFRQTLQDRSLWLVAVLFLLHNFFAYTLMAWMPTVMRLKGATSEVSGLVTSVFQWAAIPTLFLMPRLVHKLGLRKPFLWIPSIILAIGAWVVMPINLSLSWPLMALLGVVNITRFSTILALPVEMMPQEEVGAASGLVLSIGYSGAIIGPLIGGYILDITESLNASFLILVGISLTAGGITLKLPETGPRAKGWK